MSTKFKQWIDSPSSGTNIQDQTTFNSDVQRANGFASGNPASAIRVNTALREATLITTALMDTLAPNSNVDVTSSLNDVKSAIASKNAVQGGTDVSFVTTAEKYTWNNKSNFSGDYNDLTNKPNIENAWYYHKNVYIDVPQGPQAAGSYLVSFICNKDATDIVTNTGYDINLFVDKFEVLNLKYIAASTEYMANLSIINTTPKKVGGFIYVAAGGVQNVDFSTYYQGVTIRWTGNSTITPLNDYYTTDQTMPLGD